MNELEADAQFENTYNGVIQLFDECNNLIETVMNRLAGMIVDTDYAFDGKHYMATQCNNRALEVISR